MDCKKALEEADGDFDKAVEVLRIKGAKSRASAASAEAANGLVAAAEGAMIESRPRPTSSPRTSSSRPWRATSSPTSPTSSATDVESLKRRDIKDGKTVEENIQALAASIGEKLELRRGREAGRQVATLPAPQGVRPAPRRSACSCSSPATTWRRPAARRCRSRPCAAYLNRDDVPAEVVETERRVAEAKAREEGKPEAALRRSSRAASTASSRTTCCSSRPSVQDNKRTVRRCSTRPASR